MQKKKIVFDYKKFAVAALRRVSYRTPMRYAALRRARVMSGHYKCELCFKTFPRGDMQVDHINPVVPVAGWDNLDAFCERLFCSADALQVLCKPCHSMKSNSENVIRRDSKKLRKKRRK